MNTQKEIGKGILWVGIERFASQAVQFVISILIARILSPKEYGLIAMMSLFLGLAQVFVDSGFSDALIQKREKQEQDYSTVLIFNLSLGILTYVIIYLGAPVLARFYDTPDLVRVARTLGALPLITSLGIVVKARMTIHLQFREIALSTLTAVIVSGALGLWMAIHGYGVWALIAQTLGNYGIAFFLMWFHSKWLPSLEFSRESFKELWQFGSRLLLTGIINTFYVNMYTFIIGKRYSLPDAGLFNRAQTLSLFPALTVSTVLIKVFFPIQCKLEDEEEQKKIFLQSLRLGAFLVFPIMVGMIVLAKPFVSIVLKDQWLSIVPILQILCVGYMLNPLVLLNNNMLSIKGRTDYALKAEIFKKIGGFSFILALISFDVRIFCISFALYAMFDLVLVSYYVRKLTSISLVDQMSTISPIFFLAVAMGVAVASASYCVEADLGKLLIGITTGIFFYFGVGYWSKLKEINRVMTMIKKVCYGK